MAEALDDGEFWLPSEFLTDDDILMEVKKYQKTDHSTGSRFYGGFSSSSLSSPVESLFGSTETESDEEDYLAGFTRQMARSLLQNNTPKTKGMAGSPQSPLCGIGSWSGNSNSNSAGSSRGSPNGPSLVSSPPSTPLNGKDDAWDLLYAAAGQVVRMKLNDEVPSTKYGNRDFLGAPQKKPSPAISSLHLKNNSTVGSYPNQALTQQQIQANHLLYQLKQQQQQHHQNQQCSATWGRQVKPSITPQHQHQQHQQVPNGGRPVGLGNTRCSNRPLGLPPSAWPPLQNQQHQNGSGMRAVFLNGSGARRESSGTGVFLPRRNGIASESRRKPACSTVLVPTRVAQALNLNFDDFNGGAPQRFVNGNGLLPQHKRSYRAQPAINTDLQLPQEWTY